ncbi:MAG: diacylglycerol kinase family protein [Anaerolineales bacterium]|nr:diacylglycerol kinase family protein [Anaerolineales bacterium]
MAAPAAPRRRAANRLAAFRHAFHGWWYVVRTQENAWIHALASAAVFVMSGWLGLDPTQWAIIFLTVALVWASEFINTSIEATVDLASPELHPLAKIGKDVGAAAVLVAALNAVIVGLLILGPPLWTKLVEWYSRLVVK